MTFRERSFCSLALGSFIFVMDWSGYDRFNVDLFVPKALKDVWWHLPALIAGIFVTLEVYAYFNDDGPRSLGL
jgi:hypothetical protein